MDEFLTGLLEARANERRRLATECEELLAITANAITFAAGIVPPEALVGAWRGARLDVRPRGVDAAVRIPTRAARTGLKSIFVRVRIAFQSPGKWSATIGIENSVTVDDMKTAGTVVTRPAESAIAKIKDWAQTPTSDPPDWFTIDEA